MFNKVRQKVNEKLNSMKIDRRKPTFMNRLYKWILWMNELFIYKRIKNRLDSEDEAFFVEEWYNLFFISALALLVLIGPWIHRGCWILTVIFLVIAIYRILDLLIAHLKIVLLDSDNTNRTDDGYINIRHAQRWICFLLVDLLQVVLAFAVIYWVIDVSASSCKAPFNEHFYIEGTSIDILGSLKIGVNAFYFSLVTVVTLGYGDFYPTTAFCRLIVSLQILVGLFLLFSVFVIAMPTIKTKIDFNKKWKK